MVCRSPSVNRVASNSNNALKAIETLENGLKGQTDRFNEDFSKRIDDALKASNITDALLMTDGIEIKVDFANEFNVDAVTTVVVNAIKSYGAATAEAGGKESKSITAAATTKDALDSYVALVNSIGEAARSSSSTSSSFSFSMNRLGPGMFLFISAKSSNVKDVETFGTQAVVATSYIYRVMRSEQDVKATTHFNQVLVQAGTFKQNAELDAEIIQRLKQLQSGLIDKIGKEMDFDEYLRKDKEYEDQVETIQERLDNEHFKTPQEPKGRLLAGSHDGHPLIPDTPHNFSYINIPIKKMRWNYDHENLQYINHLHGELSCNLSLGEVYGGGISGAVGLTPTSNTTNNVAKLAKLSQETLKKELTALEKAAEVVKKRLDKNAVGNINKTQIDNSSRSMLLARLSTIRMTDGFASGIMVQGEHIYWNQHITFDTANPPAFPKHSTTQIRLRSPQANIIGNIRTYLSQNGQQYTQMAPGSLQQLIPDYLFTWAQDAHDTYTKKHLH